MTAQVDLETLAKVAAAALSVIAALGGAVAWVVRRSIQDREAAAQALLAELRTALEKAEESRAAWQSAATETAEARRKEAIETAYKLASVLSETDAAIRGLADAIGEKKPRSNR